MFLPHIHVSLSLSSTPSSSLSLKVHGNMSLGENFINTYIHTYLLTYLLGLRPGSSHRAPQILLIP